MTDAFSKMKNEKSTVKIKLSGTANAPFNSLKDEIALFLIEKGYTVADVDSGEYNTTIRVSVK